MWWKLTVLALVTAVLVFGVIPIRTRAVFGEVDRVRDQDFTLIASFRSMYLTPGAVVTIVVILAIAGFIAFRLIRAHRRPDSK